MKIDSKKIHIFASTLFILTFFNLFVPNTFNQILTLIALLVPYTILSKIFVKDKRIDNLNKGSVILLVSVMAVLYIVLLYLLGFHYSFYKNSIKFGLNSFLRRILPYSVIVLCSEIIRKIFITKEKKSVTVIATISLILIEVTTYLGLYSLWDIHEILMLVGYVIFSAISTNLLMNYIAKRYGIIPNILYRIITTVYIYIIPLLPNVHMYFQSVYRIIYPFIVYLIIDSAFEKDDFRIAKNEKRANIISLLLGIFMIVGFVMLISCEFKFGLVAVGSSSMTGSIDKGDAIVYEEYINQDLHKEDVIVFNKDGLKVIHRIVNIQKKNGELIYYTKGDNNQRIDDGFITDKDIIGIVKFKIVKIGWPTIWVSEIIR